MPIFDCALGRQLTAEEEALRTANEVVAPAPVPQAVTPLQMRRALRQLSLKDMVNAFVAGAGEEAQEAWEYAIEVRRDDALVAAAAASIDMTSDDLDDLFRLAATMTV